MGKVPKNFEDYSFDKLSPERRREIARKGGLSNAAKNKAARDLDTLMLLMLECEAIPALKQAAQQFLPDLGQKVCNGAVLNTQLMKKAFKGDVKAIELAQQMARRAAGKIGTEEKPTTCDMALHIGRDFVDIYRRIAKSEVSDVWLPGGRGSLKSSFASLVIAYMLTKDKDANAVIMQAYRTNIRDGSYAQMQWALNMLGLEDKWIISPAALRMRNKETGQLILFRGCDDPKKLKSVKFTRGSCKFLWLEEVDLFRGMEEIRSIKQSVTRGGECLRIYTFNPPKSVDNWANVECDRVKAAGDPKSCVVTSSYLDAPAEWLGEQFIEDAEGLKEIDELAYKHEYLGEAVGVGGAVFTRAEFTEIKDAEIARFDRFLAGQDFGWFPDPWAFVISAWHPATRTLYSFSERGGKRLQPADCVDLICDAATFKSGDETKPTEHKLVVYSDDADPSKIQAMRDLGIEAVASGKGGKRMQSYEWLSGIKWVIDPVRCPNLAREVRAMSYQQDRDGTWLNAIPDGNDHWIDAVRYSVMHIVARRGAYSTDKQQPRKYVSPFN